MSFAAFEAFRTNPAQWLPHARDIARAHALPHAEIRAFPDGTNLVAALDDHLVLKLFPPMLHHQFVSERASLQTLHGALSIPIPEIVALGERDQWFYLIMTRMKGIVGGEVWPGLAEPQKERILERIGRVIAEVQAVAPGDLLALDPPWETFLPRQIAGCLARHTRLGLPQKYLDGLPAYLEESAAILPLHNCSVILTGEYIPENFLLEQGPNGWDLSGLIDFGDVMTGWGEYDLLGPSAFMAGGRPGRIRSLLRGYGYADAKMDAGLRRRLMTLFLLHRFSDLPRQIRIDGWQDQAQSLPELEKLLWPF